MPERAANRTVRLLSDQEFSPGDSVNPYSETTRPTDRTANPYEVLGAPRTVNDLEEPVPIHLSGQLRWKRAIWWLKVIAVIQLVGLNLGGILLLSAIRWLPQRRLAYHFLVGYLLLYLLLGLAVASSPLWANPKLQFYGKDVSLANTSFVAVAVVGGILVSVLHGYVLWLLVTSCSMMRVASWRLKENPEAVTGSSD